MRLKAGVGLFFGAFVMSMGSIPEQAAEAGFGAPKFGLVWALKRALLGIIILVVSLGSLAWLTHAAIDPNFEEADGLIPTIGRVVGNF